MYVVVTYTFPPCLIYCLLLLSECVFLKEDFADVPLPKAKLHTLY